MAHPPDFPADRKSNLIPGLAGPPLTSLPALIVNLLGTLFLPTTGDPRPAIRPRAHAPAASRPLQVGPTTPNPNPTDTGLPPLPLITSASR